MPFATWDKNHIWHFVHHGGKSQHDEWPHGHQTLKYLHRNLKEIATKNESIENGKQSIMGKYGN